MASAAREGVLIRVIHSRSFSIIIRVALGSIFAYAAWPKIADPPAFAQVIWNYKILPSVLINPLAIVLPWLEMLTGLALITGIFRRGASLLVGGMLIIFIAALATDIIRNIPVYCGCFSVTPVAKSHEELINEMKIDLLRDLGMLLMTLQVFVTRVTWRDPGLTR